ncbi:16S rRNA (adenine(1518)-N(6)/adenine(1519)-N(6))-dimethyltransferase RsmA [Filifactor villosus]|uniref:Ribosomal RNA small subunit methyltransferase A n=1 Tax=Filifactor villosus TaxID=29374 RepID=A0ABV9QJ70_9FIRM
MDQELIKPGVLKEITKRHDFRFTKSLGQNFLIDANILDKIIRASDIGENDIVIEVGTGIGTLTKELAERAKKVYAIEIDKKLIPIVEETTSQYNNIVLINKDFLETQLTDIVEEKNSPVKVIANIPYYITTPIIMKCLESEIFVDTLVLMIQKEVAERLGASASTKQYGSLSVAVQYYANVEFVSKVSKTSFYPIPNVDSGIVKLRKKPETDLTLKDKELFFQVTRGSFAKRRKTILNSLIGYTDFFTKELVKKALEHAEIDPKRRGESLDIIEFAKLSNSFFELRDFKR